MNPRHQIPTEVERNTLHREYWDIRWPCPDCGRSMLSTVRGKAEANKHAAKAGRGEARCLPCAERERRLDE